MSMQAESLEVLEKADVPSGQARAIVRAIEIEIEGARDTLATKHDILMLRQEMSEMRSGLRQEISEMHNGLRQEMAGLRGDLRAEIHASASSIARQMYASLLGQMAVLLGIAYFFVTHVV